MARYYHVYIPIPLGQELQALLRDHPELGYRSPSDATREALRRFLRELRDEVARQPAPAPSGPAPATDPRLTELVAALARYFEPRKPTPARRDRAASKTR